MKKLFKYILFIVLLVGCYSGKFLIYEKRGVTYFKTDAETSSEKIYKIYSVPSNYILCGIAFEGSGTNETAIFQYTDSSKLYFADHPNKGLNHNKMYENCTTVQLYWRTRSMFLDWDIEWLKTLDDTAKNAFLDIFHDKFNVSFRYIYNNRPNDYDAVDISGITENGLYWRDVKLWNTCMGYINATDSTKDMLDKCIDANIEKFYSLSIEERFEEYFNKNKDYNSI